MQFSKCGALWALFALSSASPIAHNTHSLQVASPVERGLFWTPGGVQRRENRFGRNDGRNRGRNNIIIAQPINVQLTQIQIIQEVQIINVVQNLIIVNGLESARDNVRRNHYRNRNRNRDVNTVIIIVVVVVDARDNNNQNLRYLTRQVESNPDAQTKEWVVLTESSTLTVGGQDATAGLGPTAVAPPAAFPTAESQAELGVFDPNAALQQGSDALLPYGISAPQYEGRGARRDQDPAIILEENQLAFVVIIDANGNDNRNDDDNRRGRKDDDRRD